MGVPQQLSSSLKCELRIIQAKNIDPKSTSNLFVRYHLSPSATNKRVTLNTHEVSSNESNNNLIYWGSSFSLECFGSSHDSMQNLMHQSVVFELRSRKSIPLLGKVGASRLVGRAEVPWRDVFECPNMEIHKWVMMEISSSRTHEYGRVHGDGDFKVPLLQIQMKVEVPSIDVVVAKSERRRRYDRLKEEDECCCGCQDGGCNCVDYDVFALTAAFEAF